MRKLKNVELVGKTRLIPGVGHVVMAEEMHAYVAEACDAAGMDWFEDGASTSLSNQASVLVTGAADAADADENASEDASDANENASEDAGKTPIRPLDKLEAGGAQGGTATGQNVRKRKVN
ncbi:MAG: hypothetical protein Q8K92_08255 [Leadbetterella sp.]|nr:hypothetical protein [Leadbetterella sp.]